MCVAVEQARAESRHVEAPQRAPPLTLRWLRGCHVIFPSKLIFKIVASHRESLLRESDILKMRQANEKIIISFVLLRKGQSNNASFRGKGSLRRSCIIQRDNEQSITEVSAQTKRGYRHLGDNNNDNVVTVDRGTTTHIMDKELRVERVEKAKNNTDRRL